MDLWTCTQCASLNSRRSGRCYSCGSSRYPEAAGASGASRKRRSPLYLVIGGVATVIVALAGIVGRAIPPAALGKTTTE